MVHAGEFWLAYQFASRGNTAATSQLIELEYQHQKLIDLEDVLDYDVSNRDNDVHSMFRTDIQVFRQGFVEARHRPVTTWARKDGVAVRSSDNVDELLKQGVGRCSETAIKLLVEDAPTTLWFTYHFVHSPNAKVSIQRVRLNQGIKFEHLAHLTNHVFGHGYLPAHYRPLVHWETKCGQKLTEDTHVLGFLADGHGSVEDRAIKLVVDAHHFHHHHHHSPCSPHHPSPHHPSPHHPVITLPTPSPSPCTPHHPHSPVCPF